MFSDQECCGTIQSRQHEEGLWIEAQSLVLSAICSAVSLNCQMNVQVQLCCMNLNLNHINVQYCALEREKKTQRSCEFPQQLKTTESWSLTD